MTITLNFDKTVPSGIECSYELRVFWFQRLTGRTVVKTTLDLTRTPTGLYQIDLHNTAAGIEITFKLRHSSEE